MAQNRYYSGQVIILMSGWVGEVGEVGEDFNKITARLAREVTVRVFGQLLLSPI